MFKNKLGKQDDNENPEQAENKDDEFFYKFTQDKEMADGN